MNIHANVYMRTLYRAAFKNLYFKEKIASCFLIRRIVEYPELEGSHENHQVQLLAPQRTTKTQQLTPQSKR